VEETVEFESRGMLKKLNLMTREDIKILTARLESLSKKLDEYVVRQVRHEDAASEVPVILNAAGKPAKATKTTRATKTTKTVKAARKSGPKKG
jgi:hypothetical protein